LYKFLFFFSSLAHIFFSTPKIQIFYVYISSSREHPQGRLLAENIGLNLRAIDLFPLLSYTVALFFLNFDKLNNIQTEIRKNMDFEQPKPEGTKQLDIQESPHKLLIIKQWNRLLGYIFTGFSILWTSIASFIFSGFTNNLWNFDAPIFVIGFQLIFAIIPMFFILIGVAIFYIGIAHIFNKTIIKIENGLVEINHGPIPLMRAQRIPQQNITQIYVSDAPQNKDTNTGANNGYQISYIDNAERGRPLMGRLGFLPISLPLFEFTEARTIERCMEDFIGIEDKAVFNAETNQNKSLLERKKLYEDALEANRDDKKEKYSNKESNNYREEETSSETSLNLLPIPESLMVEESIDGLFIFKKWRSPIVIFYIIFATIWNAVTWTIASLIGWAVISTGEFLLIFFALFLIPFISIGVWMIIMSLSIIFNTTTIHVGNSELVISHSPIPSMRNRRFLLENIRNFELLTRTRRTKNGSYTYQVLAINVVNGPQIELAANSMMSFSEEEVQYLEHKLTKSLK